MRIEYYTESIAQLINSRFSKLLFDDTVINRVATTVVKLVIAHELRHVWQFVKGQITHEIITSEKEKDYTERIYEVEAKAYSEHLINGLGKFEELVIKVINGKICIDNNNISRFFDTLNR